MSNHHVLHFSTSTSPVPLFQSEHECVGGIDGIMGGTTALKEVLDRARRVAPTDARVDHRGLIAATNRDLALAMQEGRFREDLFYRLSVFPIQLPPLRDRAEDISTLAEYFLQRAAVRLRRRFNGIETASLRRLQEYEWPGNIRQLQNVIEQSAILCDEGLLHVAASALAPACTGARLSSLMAVPEGATPTLEEIKKDRGAVFCGTVNSASSRARERRVG